MSLDEPLTAKSACQLGRFGVEWVTKLTKRAGLATNPLTQLRSRMLPESQLRQEEGERVERYAHWLVN